MTAFTPLPIEDPSVVTTTNQVLNTIIDEASSTVTYIGKAAPGSATSSAAWSIQKMSKSGSVLTIQRADSGNFSQVWDNRTSLTYT